MTNHTHCVTVCAPLFLCHCVIVCAPLSLRRCAAASEWYPDPQPPLTGTSLYHYLALPKIIARHPYASGFLWARDDVIVPYWALLTASKARVWWGGPGGEIRREKHEIEPPMKGYRGSFNVQYNTVQDRALRYRTGEYTRALSGEVRGVAGGTEGADGGTWVHRPAFRNQVATVLSLLSRRCGSSLPSSDPPN